MEQIQKFNKKKFSLKGETIFIIMFILLFVYLASFIYIYAWGFITSMKDPSLDYAVNKVGLPRKWIFDNYKRVILTMQCCVGPEQYVGVAQMYLNTVLYTVGSAFFSTLVPCITAYLCAKFKYKLSGILVGIVVVTMSLPIVGSTPSALQLNRTIGIYDTIWGMWFLAANFQVGIHFLIFYDAFCGVPNAFREAAEIDGASNMQVMIKIMLPLVKNAFATIFLLRLIGYWNDYQTPLLYIPSHPTIAYGLYYFTVKNTVGGNMNEPTKIAGAFFVCIPIFIVFLIFQNRIMTNISIGGIKG